MGRLWCLLERFESLLTYKVAAAIGQWKFIMVIIIIKKSLTNGERI